ncbi:hypothetical protein RB594_009105 [Gaeumannomyces avenae]
MDSRKRKAPIDIYRRVKVRKDMPESDDEEWDGVSNGSEVDERDGSGEDEKVAEDQSEGQSEDGESSEEPEVDASSISFGALAKAQDSVPRPEKRRPGASPTAGQGRRHRPRAGDDSESDSEGSDGSAGSGDELAKTGRESGGRGAADNKSAAAGAAPKPKKKSKSAPEEVSSKRRVSRYREVVTRLPNARPKARDPRFEHPGAEEGEEETAADAARRRRNYAFLDEYRDAELRQMRETLAASNRAASSAAGRKKRKRGGDKTPQLSPEEREELKRNIMAMENQNRARERKDRQEELLAEHRKKEKELVRQGKKPFYLKRSEQKKMLLMDQYAGMSKGQVDKAIERKRKKVAGKEKKMLPFARRGATEN